MPLSDLDGPEEFLTLMDTQAEDACGLSHSPLPIFKTPSHWHPHHLGEAAGANL